ncbi:hypothetical protein OSB04_026846 [Centaurea solstitialis]|uniref:PROP1-like PPR domain-containing protein n=1 Tax=Centaurea solstitialis TaxID=347529 RepID=A0AA38SQ68_9ASTR|nr:hypothetical protein OSB04_026846 [Centaurea solstitialis]
MSSSFSNGSLHFPSIPTTHMTFTHIPSLSFNFCLEHPRKKPTKYTVICASIRSKRNSKSEENAEAQELVRTLLKNFNYDKPLLSTLNKYVKLVRTEHCFLLFEELGKSDKWLQCLEVFRWMQKQRWYVADNGVYSKLISVMGKKGQTRMAMWLFSEMRNSGCRPDTSVYNALITAHLHSKDKPKALSKAFGYFEKMKATERCKPSIVTYNILLRAFAQARDVAQVEALFKDVEESIVTPDIFTFNGVMDAYGKNGMIGEMEGVLSRMKSKQIRPDIISYNLLIDSYGRKQEFEKMEQVFKSLLRSKERPTLSTFNSMITNYGKARLREKADSVFQKITDMGYAPNFITYECMIMMYGCCDCVSRAREIFDKMVESEKIVKSSTLNVMLNVYCLNGLPMEADRLFETACNSEMFRVDLSTYKLLYKFYTKADLKELLQKLMRHMDRDGIVPNKRFFLDALGALGSSDRDSVPRKVDLRIPANISKV